LVVALRSGVQPEAKDKAEVTFIGDMHGFRIAMADSNGSQQTRSDPNHPSYQLADGYGMHPNRTATKRRRETWFWAQRGRSRVHHGDDDGALPRDELPV
jgi:hypothetical protein